MPQSPEQTSFAQNLMLVRKPTVICLSHLRWRFVFQRPQHLMTRFARDRSVIFFEEAVLTEQGEPHLDCEACPDTGVTIATPRLPAGLPPEAEKDALARMLDGLVAAQAGAPVLWYYTPMMLTFSRQVKASAVVYDCMDELSNFKFAPPELPALEAELMDRADVVFTGGHSLYEAKRTQHANIHPFPSSVDRAHFSKARQDLTQPADQAGIPDPRLGYFGVIDERMDLELIAALADARPDWSIVMVGPVVKIDEASLPRRANIHYLGGKDYRDLPAYLSGWSVALAPFAINDATRFISPTKTPEYLAGGRPVVSTAIRDVVRHYGALQAVGIAEGPADFVAQCDAALTLQQGDGAWLKEADAMLSDLSWDRTFERMDALVSMASTMDAAQTRGSAERGGRYDYLVVGAGFAGAVIAERLAVHAGARVLVIDRRDHVAGNAYDHHDAAGVLVHKYGPHIFHTNSDEVFNYLSRFTSWRPYEHRVLASSDVGLTPIPINRTTLNAVFGLELADEPEAQAFLNAIAEPVATPKSSEDVVVSQVGRALYERFFQGYTRKQWGLDPSQLDKAVAARVPARTNTDDRYFTDRHQAMPSQGYTKMFQAILDHPNIEVRLGVEYEEIRDTVRFGHTIFCGPIDEFFDYRFGKLPYRSLRFWHQTLDQAAFQPAAVVNYPSEDVPYTRITEYKQLTGQLHAKTSISYEYPCDDGDPYYPIPREENQALYKRYEALARETPNVTFLGRLGTYKYYNMDQVVAQALATYRKLGLAEQSAIDLTAESHVARA